MRAGIWNYNAGELRQGKLRIGLFADEVRRALADALDHGELRYYCQHHHTEAVERLQSHIRVTRQETWDFLGDALLMRIGPSARCRGEQIFWDVSGFEDVYLLLRFALPHIRSADLRSRIEEDFVWMEGRWPELKMAYEMWAERLAREAEERP